MNIISCTYLLLEKIDLVNFMKTTNFFDKGELGREHENTIFVGG